jgi:two-component system, cell cycle response regulator
LVEKAGSRLNTLQAPADTEGVNSVYRTLIRDGTPRAIRIALGVLFVLVAVHLLHTVLGLSPALGAGAYDIWLYDAVMVGCAAACIARAALVGDGRFAWLCLGLGLACDASGEILASISESFAPTAQDVLYLCLYLGAYVAIVLLGRRRALQFRASMWLDGVIGALAVGSLGALALSRPGFLAKHGAGVRAALNISYPLTDVLLIGVAVVMLALGGWRGSRPFAMIALGFLVMAIADGVYLFQEAHGGYTVGTPLDSLWLLAALTLASGAWQPDGRTTLERQSLGAIMAAPMICGLTAIGVLLYGSFEGVEGASIWLAAATLVSVLLRLLATAREHLALLVSSSELARRDALTGLSNRRVLLQDLELALTQATAANPRLMLLFDLNGFKRYNDTFGHPAGDALLQRLAGKLAVGVANHGRAYRLGGDEFCALLEVTEDPIAIAPELASCLLERGERFTIGASYGEVLLGVEAATAQDALRIADQRLYVQKRHIQLPPSSEWRDVLLGLQRERDPELGSHAQQVADLAHQLGTRLGMQVEDLRDLVATAELHDIGKAAIPDAILEKPGALDPDERAFIERHTIIGERILAEAATGRRVAAMVRATHERYDGRGYPDGLAGEQIPLAARIVAICDAYQAMTSPRPYQGSIPEAQALAELARGAGTQFDPELVGAFVELVSVDSVHGVSSGR